MEGAGAQHDQRRESLPHWVIGCDRRGRTKPALLELDEHNLLISRLTYRNSYDLDTTVNNVFEGPTQAIVLFKDVKGWTFFVRQDTKAVQFATRTHQEMIRWLEFFHKHKLLQFPSPSLSASQERQESALKGKEEEGEKEREKVKKPKEGRRIKGFLWMRPHGKDQWMKHRYYCIADGSCMECFEPSNPPDCIKFLAIKKIERGEGKLEHYIDFGHTARRSYHLSRVRDYSHSVSLYTGQGNRLLKFTVKSKGRMEAVLNIVSNKTVTQFQPSPSSPSMGGAAAAQPINSSGDHLTPATPTDLEKQILWGYGIAETPQVVKLRTKIQEFMKKGKDQTGQTPYGDYDTSKRVGDGKIRMLTLDGGGLRAIIQVVILVRLVRVFPDLLERIDVFAGVSGGSIVAAFLASGKSPSFIHDVWMELGPVQFDASRGSTLGGISVSQAKYSSDMLLVVAAEIWKNMSLAQLPKKLICLSFLLDNKREGKCRSWEPKVYHNIPEDEDADEPFLTESERHKTLIDVIMGSSAAPTYFPSHDRHIDGGVFANDPTLSAVVALITPTLHTDTKNLSDIHVLSIGTGNKNQFIEGEYHDWGIYQWTKKGNKGGRQLIELMKAAPALHSQFSTDKLLGRNYHRVNPPFVNQVFALDDPSVLKNMVEMAFEYDINRTIEWIRNHFYDDEVDGEQPTTPSNMVSPSSSPRDTSSSMWKKAVGHVPPQKGESDKKKQLKNSGGWTKGQSPLAHSSHDGKDHAKQKPRDICLYFKVAKATTDSEALSNEKEERKSEEKEQEEEAKALTWGSEDLHEVLLPEEPSLRTYKMLIQKVAAELEVKEDQLVKIRKLPCIVVNKDEHVGRLHEGTVLEVFM